MGNSFPITSIPKPTESRAIIYIRIRGVLGTLAVEQSQSEIPSVLNGTVPACVFGVVLSGISERCRSFRGELRFRCHSCFLLLNSQELTLNLFDPVCLLIRFNKRWSRLVVFHACHDYQLLLEN